MTKGQSGASAGGDYGETDWWESFGDERLSCWRVGRHTWRFQTRDPQLAAKLSERSKARLVLFSVYNGYLRAFDEDMERHQAHDLVTRYLTPPNGRLLERKGPLLRGNGQPATQHRVASSRLQFSCATPDRSFLSTLEEKIYPRPPLTGSHGVPETDVKYVSVSLAQRNCAITQPTEG